MKTPNQALQKIGLCPVLGSCVRREGVDMDRNIPEADWRQFKRVFPVLMERFCQRVLDDLAKLLRVGGSTAHDQYLRIYVLIQERDKDLGDAFDDFRRSTAILQLLKMRRLGLLSEEELSEFSEETQTIIRRVDSFRSAEPCAQPKGPQPAAGDR